MMNFSADAAKVHAFWLKVGTGEGSVPSPVKQHADAWGLKKLTSYALRRIKMGHKSRESCHA